MSSDEDNDSHVAVLAQDRIKKVKRTRQRVDAGEPRNSYASIPSYSPGRPSPNQNGMGAKSLNELLARSLSTCNPLKERNGEDLISEKLINGTPLELSPLLPPGMIGNGELMSQALEMAGNAGFRLGMVRTGSPPLESSKLLREILQGKKQGQFINSSTPLGSPTTGFKTSNGIITQLLKGNLSNINNGAEESDESSHNQAGDMLQVLSDDSDMESKSSAENPNEIDMNSRDKSNSDSQSMSIRNENGHGSHLPEDPILLKRARVETIVTNMRMSPTRINSDQLSNSASPEVRKQKRKQYQPQLYDSRCIAHTVPKHRRLEREMLKKQLKQMQDQLAEMQQRYCELFENESSEESEGVGGDFISKNIEERNGTEVINHSCNDMPKTEDQAQAYGAKSDRPNMSKDFELDGKVTTAISEDSSQELDPGHFIDQARKLVSEQEKLAKITDTKLDLPSKLCSQNLDWNSLAQALKTELTTSFSVIIDSILTRFVQNQVNKPILDKEIVKDLSVTSSANIPRKPVRAKVTDKGKSFTNSSNPHPTFSPFPEPKVSHRLSPFTLHPSAPLYNHTPHHPASLYNHHVEPMPEQTEPMPLIVTPKKKRHKVTDTRISPRTVSRVLSHESEGAKYPPPLPAPHDGPFPALLPASLPTTVAIPNPSLNQSDLFGRFSYEHNQISYQDPIDIDNKALAIPNHYPIGGPGTPLTPGDTISHMKSESAENSDGNSSDIPSYDSSMATRYLFLNSSYSSTLTPMHLRKAKLMFFFVRYPSSAILKMYFPDIKFNKNNTAQLIKWFSNFREFYYIQMEKYARQAISEGVKNGDELTVTTDSELYRVLNLHYNRNNHIEVPPNFRNVVEQTLREFFKALIAGKDQEQSWKKSIYKIIARMDDPLPEYFKNPNFLEQLE